MAKFDLNKITIKANKELANKAWNASIKEVEKILNGNRKKPKSFDEWWLENIEQSESSSNKHIVMPSAFMANIEGKEYVVFERRPRTIHMELELYKKADMAHGVLHNLKYR